jgi:hypothetical protein
MNDSFGQGKFNVASPAIILVDADLPYIFTLAVWTFHRKVHLYFTSKTGDYSLPSCPFRVKNIPAQ